MVVDTFGWKALSIANLAFILVLQLPLVMDILFLAYLMVFRDVSDPKRIITSVEARSSLLE